MKIIYFDCFAGVSGDMILGALIDTGVSLEKLKSELAQLKLSGYDISAEKTVKRGISGTRVNVGIEEQKAQRNLSDIIRLINQSGLADDVKSSSRKIFETLAGAEAKIHDTTPEKIHFHEVGAVDAIIDIVGSVICLKLLAIDHVFVSRIHVGRGFVDCRHGKLPVPAPATIEILKGIPVYSTGIEKELTTPTGAAILKTLSRNFGDTPQMKLTAVGYGAGSHELEIPNLLRVLVGETDTDDYDTDTVTLIETNIDDMNPEFFDFVTEKLMEHGALDVYTTPALMKKNRPGTVLSVLSGQDKVDEIISIILSETTTLGVRIQQLQRKKLAREIFSVATKFGDIRVKISRFKDQIKNIAPEYDDCKKIASEKNIPIKDIYYEAKRAAGEILADSGH